MVINLHAAMQADISVTNNVLCHSGASALPYWLPAESRRQPRHFTTKEQQNAVLQKTCSYSGISSKQGSEDFLYFSLPFPFHWSKTLYISYNVRQYRTMAPPIVT